MQNLGVGRGGRLRSPLLLVVAAALLIAGYSLSTSAAAVSKATASGGTVTMALQAGVPVNYIFPFFSSQYTGFSNMTDFQELMYRPLYWWDGSPYHLNIARSLAQAPVFRDNNTVVVITLKHNWKFSDGETLSPANVAFFLGMLIAERTNFWLYLPGGFPDTLASVSYNNSQDTVTLRMKKSVNPTWFIENQLTMITPLPLAWDLSGPGKPSDCASESASVEARDCPAVYKYLSAQSADTATYATNKLWQVVDGPFRLSKFVPGGTSITLVPNPDYSGLPKPRISALVLEAATSDASEFSLLASGALTIGYVPSVSAPVKPVNASAPTSNPVPGYVFEPPIAAWAYNDIFWNYNNPQLSPLLHQLYFRQAMQSLIDQKGDIKAALRGYGYVDFGPNPPMPSNQFETSYEKSDPYPYSPSKARLYLTSNGWKVPSSGQAYCVRPGKASGDCGAGIASGERIPVITLRYATGSEAWTLEMSNLQSDASIVGIRIVPIATPTASLAANFAGCTISQSSCKWEMMYLGTDETDFGDFYPESGVVFRAHAVFNVSNYRNSYVESLLTQIYTAPGNVALDALDNYLTKTCALLWTPVPNGLLYEVSPKLKGFVPSPISVIEPENWYFAK